MMVGYRVRYKELFRLPSMLVEKHTIYLEIHELEVVSASWVAHRIPGHLLGKHLT